MGNRLYVNNFATTLSGAISSTGATSCTITSATGLPTLTGGDYYYLTIDDHTNIEIVKVTARTGTTLTIVRGQESSVAATFASGVAVEMRATAEGFTNILANIGITPDVTELNYVDGVTSSIQAQLNAKAALDSNSNFTADRFLPGYNTTASSAGTLTLTVDSKQVQYITGSTTHIIQMPVVSTLTLGDYFVLVNLSTGNVTVNSSGSNLIQTLTANSVILVRCTTITGTTASSWAVENHNVNNLSGLGPGVAAFLQKTMSLADPGADRIVFWDDSADQFAHLTPGTGLTITGTTMDVSISPGASSVLTLIDTKTASSSATLDFTGLGDYSDIMFIINDIAPATDNVRFQLRTSTDNGSTYDAGAGAYRYGAVGIPDGGTVANIVSAGDTEMELWTGSGNDTNESLSGKVELFNPAGTGYGKVTWQLAVINATGAINVANGAGMRASAGDIDAIRFMFASGNIASGKIYCYGYRKLSTGSSGVNDGDFGDITVSASGTAISVDLPASVTPATDDKVYLFDTSASNAKKYALVSDIVALATGGGLTKTTASGTTQAAAVNTLYTCTNAAQCNVTLPATAAVNDIVAIQSQGAGGIKATANTGQTIKVNGTTTTSAGNIVCASQYDAIEVICVVANTTWAVRSYTSNLLTVS